MKMVKVILSGLLVFGMSANAWGMDDGENSSTSSKGPISSKDPMPLNLQHSFCFEEVGASTLTTAYEELDLSEFINFTNFSLSTDDTALLNALKNRLRITKKSGPLNCLLIQGPMGSGKQKLAEYLAHEIGFKFEEVNILSLLTKISAGNGFLALLELFESIKRNNLRPTIILIPHIDLLFKNIEDEQIQHLLAKQFCDSLLEFKKYAKQLFFVLTTSNYIFVPKVIKLTTINNTMALSLPKQTKRQLILNNLLQRASGLTVENTLSQEYAQKTAGWTLRELATLISEGTKQVRSVAPRERQAALKSNLANTLKRILALYKIEFAPHQPHTTLYFSDDVNKLINPIIMQLKINPELQENNSTVQTSSLMLYGSPGVGKSELANKIAWEAKAKFIKLLGANIVNKMQGSGSEKISLTFSRAKSLPGRVVVFIDELESLSTQKAASKGTGEDNQRAMTTLWDELITCEKHHPNIFIIAASNNLKLLKRQIKDRFDQAFKIEYPDQKLREKMIKGHAETLGKTIETNFKVKVKKPGWFGDAEQEKQVDTVKHFATKTKNWDARNIYKMVKAAAIASEGTVIKGKALDRAFENRQKFRKNS